MPAAPMWALILAIPYAVLALAGVLLWKRQPSVATALVALGFAAVLLSEVVGLVESFEYTSIVRAHPDASFVVAHYHTAPRVIHFAGILGLWGAAIGLTWHVVRRR